MSNFYGNPVARDVRNGVVDVGPGAWVPLTSSLPQGGSGTQSILSKRQWIKIQLRGPGGLAIAYTSKTRHGDTYASTQPSYTAQSAMVYQANTVIQEPLSEDVQMWGRYTAKAGASAGGMKVVVTEYA